MKRNNVAKGVAVDQLLLYILALFLSGLILFYGYRAITGLQKRADEVALIQFEKKLQAKIESIASQYDSVRIEELAVPQGVEKVCFADEKESIPPDKAGLCEGSNYHPVVCNALLDKAENVFLLPAVHSLRVAKIKLREEGTICIPIRGGTLTLRLRGEGDGTHVEEARTG